eukprot:749519-Hanusia_phi.AAC.1
MQSPTCGPAKLSPWQLEPLTPHLVPRSNEQQDVCDGCGEEGVERLPSEHVHHLHQPYDSAKHVAGCDGGGFLRVGALPRVSRAVAEEVAERDPQEESCGVLELIQRKPASLGSLFQSIVPWPGKYQGVDDILQHRRHLGQHAWKTRRNTEMQGALSGVPRTTAERREREQQTSTCIHRKRGRILREGKGEEEESLHRRKRCQHGHQAAVRCHGASCLRPVAGFCCHMG